MSDKETKQSWLEPVGADGAKAYILKKYHGAIVLQVIELNNKYSVSFYNGSDIFNDLSVVMLTPFMTSIDGQEFDKDWIDIVRDANEGRTIDGWTYDRDLVRALEVMIYDKKREAIKKAEEEYKQDVDFLNDLFKELKIEEEIEPRQF